jgi:hypothetical protein
MGDMAGHRCVQTTALGGLYSILAIGCRRIVFSFSGAARRGSLR